MIFRQLFDPQSSTYTYLLADSGSLEAVLIDPVFEHVQRDCALIRELGLKLVCTLETHVHADHVTGAAALKTELGSDIVLSAKSGAEGADRYLEDRDRVLFGDRYLEVRETPGHTEGCVTYVLDDESRAFTGDCLLIRGCGRTDFQGGDPRVLYRSVHLRIFSLPDGCLLYPAHDYRGLMVTSVAEEKRFNPRLGGELSEDDFVRHVENLGLAHPRQMEIAVPANKKCGRRDGAEGTAAGPAPSWGPVYMTFAGVQEIQPHWVEENLADLRVLDVREADEFSGPLGHIPGAIHIPLGELAERTEEIPRDKPVVAVCRAGGRSARATAILAQAKFERFANLAGGMLRWRAEGLAVEGGEG
ncbi:MAG: rhodanese-like domain-containing protein [Alphaproteobacteria bacterium]|nr:rhodanese-like domain-containing protein [Alphaproteobacteria bacterium]